MNPPTGGSTMEKRDKMFYNNIMTPLFHPRLVNGPLGDPVLYVDLKYANRAVLFDLGDIRSLTPRQILKISHIFISHTHMDHFIGFDDLLRIFLGRPKVIQIYGPPNFLDQLKGKISAYTWNLVENYPCPLELLAVEVHPDRKKIARLCSSRAFQVEPISEESFEGLLYQEPFFRVRAAFVDHWIPCLAFLLEENSHINILKSELARLGLIKGPWLRELKEAIWKEEDEERIIRAFEGGNEGLAERFFPLGVLKKEIVSISRGQKIGFVTDTVFNRETQETIKNLVKGADYLFIESAFLDEEAGRARKKYHLTARQAGMIAAEAGVKRMIPFHFSPKYSSNPDRVIEEAMAIFNAMRKKKEL
jgi:ribonuclease Z